MCNICRVTNRRSNHPLNERRRKGERSVFLWCASSKGKRTEFLTPRERSFTHPLVESLATRRPNGKRSFLSARRRRVKTPAPLRVCRRWRRCRILASVARRSIDVQPLSTRFLFASLSLSSNPPPDPTPRYLATFLPPLPAPCVQPAIEIENNSKVPGPCKFLARIISIYGYTYPTGFLIDFCGTRWVSDSLCALLSLFKCACWETL